MGGAIKGIFMSLVFLIIAGTSYYAILYYGLELTFVAILCATIVAAAFFMLLYAMEKDSTAYGALVPFIALLGILLAYFGQAPFETTLALSFFVSLFVALLIQRD
jgi:uncharacterized membrane protein